MILNTPALFAGLLGFTGSIGLTVSDHYLRKDDRHERKIHRKSYTRGMRTEETGTAGSRRHLSRKSRKE